MVIINAKINTCDGGKIIEHGFIEIKNGRITGVEEGAYSGAEAEVFDAAGRLVTPGFIDSHCHIGIWESGLDFEGDDTNEMTDPATPHIRAIDAVNPLDRAFTEALKYGITAVSVGQCKPGGRAGMCTAYQRRLSGSDDTEGTLRDEVCVGREPQKGLQRQRVGAHHPYGHRCGDP